ncbi:MAG TPA: NAD(P)H-dependent oxidoreductase subunit E [Firmicutes bacterium]|jgi:NADH-quinone oxidoreductase E subunit|nr:NAD(P)H-dependent oxidoreductase subunit E [Bacillota bacterium]
MDEKKCASCGCNNKQDPRYQELAKVVEEYRGMEGALIMVLHRAQEIFGYLPEEVQKFVAKEMDLPLSEVYGVTTFYSYFSLKPRGTYRIAVCLGTACYVRGSAEIVSAIEKHLNIKVNDTTDDGRFTLEVSRCIGACGLAPVMTVNEDVYGRLTPDKVPEILAKYQ